MLFLASPAAAVSAVVAQQVAEWMRLDRWDRLVPILVWAKAPYEPEALEWHAGVDAPTPMRRIVIERQYLNLRRVQPSAMDRNVDFLDAMKSLGSTIRARNETLFAGEALPGLYFGGGATMAAGSGSSGNTDDQTIGGRTMMGSPARRPPQPDSRPA